MSDLFQNSVFVIDAMRFRRARDECFLAIWASQENVDLIGVSNEEAHAKLVESTNCRMIIYTFGDALPSSDKVLAEIRMLRALCPSAALAIVTDDSRLNSVISAVKAGVRGYFSNDLAPDIALEGLSFVLHGGSYVPLNAMLAECPDSAMMHDGNGMHDIADSALHREHGEMSVAAGQPVKIGPFTESCAHQQQTSLPELPGPLLCDHPSYYLNGAHRNGVNGSKAEPEIAIGLPPPQMTERQQAVLECLCQGLSNKLIGRKLNMTEMTVKVHVREIMRKFRVANRTQVAIICSRSCLGQGTVSDLPSVQPHEAAALSPGCPF
jgi:DNA-binding NarL/FixJ family response regulator